MRSTADTVAPEELLAGITEGYFALDREDRFLYVNDAAAEVFPVPRESLLGRVLWECFPHWVESPIHAACQHVRATGEPRQFVQFAPRVRR